MISKHPGFYLTEAIRKNHLQVNTVADALGISRSHIYRLMNEEADITPEMAVRLAVAFDTYPEHWMELQMKYELEKVRNDIEKMEAIKRDCKTLDVEYIL